MWVLAYFGVGVWIADTVVLCGSNQEAKLALRGPGLDGPKTGGRLRCKSESRASDLTDPIPNVGRLKQSPDPVTLSPSTHHTCMDCSAKAALLERVKENDIM